MDLSHPAYVEHSGRVHVYMKGQHGFDRSSWQNSFIFCLQNLKQIGNT